ncbi:6-bladed beta-propeller [Peijinzhouia sedimentorum]
MKGFNSHILPRGFIGFTLLGFLLLISCKSENAIEGAPEVIDINDYTKTDSLLSIRSLLEDVSYIQLKGADTFFLSNTKKILEIDNKLIIHDKNKEVLVAYDLEGNFLGQVGAKGEGPEEYKQVTDFDIHPQRNSIIIYSRGDQSFLEYDHSLKFIQKVRVGFWGMHMSVLESGNLAFFKDPESGSNNIAIYDIEATKIEETMPFPVGENNEYILSDFSGFLKGGFYNYPFSSEILKLQEGEGLDQVYFQINFPNMRSEEKKFAHMEYFNQDLQLENNGILWHYTVGENKKELIFYYSYKIGNGYGNTIGIKNESGQIFGHFNLKHGGPDKADEFLKLFFWNSYNIPNYSSSTNYYYSASTQEGLDYLHRIEKDTFLEGLKSIDMNLYNTLKDAKDVDNPIVMKFRFKSKI